MATPLLNTWKQRKPNLTRPSNFQEKHTKVIIDLVSEDECEGLDQPTIPENLVASIDSVSTSVEHTLDLNKATLNKQNIEEPDVKPNLQSCSTCQTADSAKGAIQRCSTPKCEKFAHVTCHVNVKGKLFCGVCADGLWGELCAVCELEGTALLCCDDCSLVYHLGCLVPALKRVPKGDWRCVWCQMKDRTASAEARLAAERTWRRMKGLCDDCKQPGTPVRAKRGKRVSAAAATAAAAAAAAAADAATATGAVSPPPLLLPCATEGCPTVLHAHCGGMLLVKGHWFCGVCADLLWESDCSVCGDCSGDLICCGECTRVCHPGCCRPPLPAVPDGAWQCAECSSAAADGAAVAATAAAGEGGRRHKRKKGKDKAPKRQRRRRVKHEQAQQSRQAKKRPRKPSSAVGRVKAEGHAVAAGGSSSHSSGSGGGGSSSSSSGLAAGPACDEQLLHSVAPGALLSVHAFIRLLEEAKRRVPGEYEPRLKALYQRTKGGGTSAIYGETLPPFTAYVARKFAIGSGDVFVDLGCGTGLPGLQLLLCTGARRCVGVELDPLRLQLARDLWAQLQQLCCEQGISLAGKEYELREADMVDCASLVATATIVYFCNFNHRFNAIARGRGVSVESRVTSMLHHHCRPGTRVITLGPLSFPDPRPRLSAGMAPAYGSSWSPKPLRVYAYSLGVHHYI